MADFTETPHAEDFMQELQELIDVYQDLGLSVEWIKKITSWVVDELEDSDD